MLIFRSFRVEWSTRENFNLDEAAKVCLPLYIKLGLDKNFVKTINHQGKGFKHIGEFFFYKTEANVKQRTFVGPEIRKVMKNGDFNTKLSSHELDA